MWTQRDSNIYTRIVDIHARHWLTGRPRSCTVAYRIDGRPDHLGDKGYRVDIKTSVGATWLVWEAIDGGKRIATLAAAKRLVNAYTRAIKAQNTLSPDMSRVAPSVVSRRGSRRAA